MGAILLFLSMLQQWINLRQVAPETKKKKLMVLRIFTKFFYNFYVHDNIIDSSNIINLHKYFTKKTWCKIIFGLIKNIFIGLLIDTVNELNNAKSILLWN